MLVGKAAEVPEIGKQGAILTNPDTGARFPCCVISPPLQSPRYQGAAWTLNVTAEVWADTQFDAIRLFDLVREKLGEYNFTLTNNLPLQQDIFTEKWRFGGYLEARWDAITNYFEKSR